MSPVERDRELLKLVRAMVNEWSLAQEVHVAHVDVIDSLHPDGGTAFIDITVGEGVTFSAEDARRPASAIALVTGLVVMIRIYRAQELISVEPEQEGAG